MSVALEGTEPRAPGFRPANGGRPSEMAAFPPPRLTSVLALHICQVLSQLEV